MDNNILAFILTILQVVWAVDVQVCQVNYLTAVEEESEYIDEYRHSLKIALRRCYISFSMFTLFVIYI